MHTGDLATMDAEGYVNIVGRLKDMVIRGGENVYPREIEEFLYRHPKIQDVQVIGVPDPKYGEEICAWIKLRAGESATAEEIREFCKGQIAHYKIPRYVEFVAEFPMTITGKIQKFVMREQTIGKLGLKAREDGLVPRRFSCLMILPAHQRGEVSASYADGGVMGHRSTVAHDPSAPAGHLPGFAREENTIRTAADFRVGLEVEKDALA